jgi:hypothetical protein
MSKIEAKETKQDLPAPNPDQKERASISKERVFARRSRVRARVQGTSLRSVGPGHLDEAGWQMHLLDALGTRSAEFSLTLLAQLEWACRNRGEKSISETTLNAALAIVDGMEAENEMEAMLGAQMAGTHSLAMELLGRARHAEHVPRTSDYVNLAVKLLRTYTAQLEVFAKLKRKGAQTVRVEHVHVHNGGRAIVGNVNHSGTGGKDIDSGENGRACARGLGSGAEHAGSSTMRSEDPERTAMPVASCERQEALPNARRRKRQRCS